MADHKGHKENDRKWNWNIVIGLAIKVHKNLEPGLLESAYKICLFYEIQKAGLFVEKEKPMPLVYEDVKLDVGYRLDLFVENKLVIDTKFVEALMMFILLKY